jgi:hypothetical protein
MATKAVTPEPYRARLTIKILKDESIVIYILDLRVFVTEFYYIDYLLFIFLSFIVINVFL